MAGPRCGGHATAGLGRVRVVEPLEPMEPLEPLEGDRASEPASMWARLAERSVLIVIGIAGVCVVVLLAVTFSRR